MVEFGTLDILRNLIDAALWTVSSALRRTELQPTPHFLPSLLQPCCLGE